MLAGDNTDERAVIQQTADQAHLKKSEIVSNRRLAETELPPLKESKCTKDLLRAK
jgi:hypothetical protein